MPLEEGSNYFQGRPWVRKQGLAAPLDHPRAEPFALACQKMVKMAGGSPRQSCTFLVLEGMQQGKAPAGAAPTVGSPQVVRGSVEPCAQVAGSRSLASCIACPADIKTAFMLKSSRAMLLMPGSTVHLTDLVASSHMYMLCAVQLSRHDLAFVFWYNWLEPPEPPWCSDKHGGSALQGLGRSACAPKNSSLSSL